MTNGFFFQKLPAAWLPLLGRCRCTLLLAILAQADGNSWDAAKTGAWTDLKKKTTDFAVRKMNGWIAFIAFKMLDPEGI